MKIPFVWLFASACVMNGLQRTISDMALRVARGLLRLWLVLSVLWIGGVGTITWPNVQLDDWVLPSGFVLPGEVEAENERRTAIQSAVLVAFLPPALVLALGSALIRAFRGFR